jgi:hypothetical protein
MKLTFYFDVWWWTLLKVVGKKEENVNKDTQIYLAFYYK